MMQLTDMNPDYGRAVSVLPDGSEFVAYWWAPWPAGTVGPVATIQVYGPDSGHLPLADLPEWTPGGWPVYYPLAALQARAAWYGFTEWADCDDWSEYTDVAS